MLLLLLCVCLILSPLEISSLNQDGLYLLKVKESLFDEDNYLSTWNSRDSTPCKWTGIKCDSVTHRVNTVDLSNFLLSGPLPTTFLCRIPYLTSLSFFNNSINSTLPPEISTCQNLVNLNLSANYFVGPIPNTLSDMQNLTTLDLSFNNFMGAIPSTFSNFRKLETLTLIQNLLNTTIPSFIFSIKSLKVLHLAYNPFTPSQLVIQLGNSTSQLATLYLAGCNLIGEIPSSINQLTTLSSLDLSTNRLTGSVPSSLTELTRLVQIELYANSLTGELPTGWSNLKALRRLDASMNGLTGTIPDELCRLELDSLNLYDNFLEGTLPESITLSPYLNELKVYNNSLTGSLPSQLGMNSPLVTLDVSTNKLTGSVPEGLCKNGELEELLLLNNSFTGEIPESLGTCKSLRRVRMSDNKLSGLVPVEMWALPHLSLFDLVDNSLSGEISDLINNARNLSNLMVSRNQFSGSIPNEIGNLRNLVEFSGSGNKFTGLIPWTLVKLSQLNKLDLSYNELDGEIPVGIQSWKKLSELNLANNKLSGEIPDEIGSLPVLNYLDLSGNYFSGKIPIGLQNLKLNVLNLSNNRLSGYIPPVYDRKVFRDSFLGNPGLCGSMVGLCPQRGESKKLVNLWMLRSIFILAGIVLIVGVVWFYLKYKKTKKITMSKWKSFHKLGFSEFEIIKSLDESNILGSGASGKVYKVVLSNGETVAVKKLWGSKGKKAEMSVESKEDGYEAEVETLGKIRHKNIVRLWCCYNTSDCKLLVYEYMLNGSLGDSLHGSKGCSLDWPTRFKIALDAAEGLSYLHHDCAPSIVHRDIKSNNILLDGEFGAKVSDFGVAKAFHGVNNDIESMSVIAGSCGYIAPEYAYTLKVNEKSDIYSFGVVILELVTGRLPIDPEYGETDLVKWVSGNLDQKGIEHVLDPKLDLKYNEEIRRVLEIGLLCTSSLPINRPSMRKVVKMLQEAGLEKKPKNVKDGKLSPYFCYEDASDQGSVV